MNLKVFIQNEAGSDQKNRHNEKTLEFLRSERVSRAYPFPYGFIIGTTAEDGLNLDCFVITEQSLKCGDIVECKPVGLMEQIEDGEEDHNVLAVVQGENLEVDHGTRTKLTNFVCHVFDHVRGKQIRVGKFLGVHEAETQVLRCRDRV